MRKQTLQSAVTAALVILLTSTVYAAPGSVKLSPKDLTLAGTDVLCIVDFDRMALIPKTLGPEMAAGIREVFQRDYGDKGIEVTGESRSGESVIVLSGKINGYSYSRGVKMGGSKGENSIRASFTITDGTGKELASGKVTAAPWEHFVQKTTRDELIEIAAMYLSDALAKAMGFEPVPREWDKD